MAADPRPPTALVGGSRGRRTVMGSAGVTVVVGLLFVSLLAVGCGGGTEGSEAPAASAPADGAGPPTGPAAAPDQVALSRFDGAPATLADYRGRPLVVNFFASWCAPCIKELPEFEQVHQELGDEVAFLGVNVRDRAADGLRMAQQTGITFDLVRDPGGELLVAMEGTAMPTTAFVAADGRLLRVVSRNYQADSLRETIDEVLLAAPAATDR